MELRYTPPRSPTGAASPCPFLFSGHRTDNHYLFLSPPFASLNPSTPLDRRLLQQFDTAQDYDGPLTKRVPIRYPADRVVCVNGMCDVHIGSVQLLRIAGADYSLVLRQNLTELVFDNMCTCQTLRGEDVKDVVRGCWVSIYGLMMHAAERSESVPAERKVSEPLHDVGYAATLTAETPPLSLAKVKISFSIDAAGEPG